MDNSFIEQAHYIFKRINYHFPKLMVLLFSNKVIPVGAIAFTKLPIPNNDNDAKP